MQFDSCYGDVTHLPLLHAMAVLQKTFNKREQLPYS